jgi:hypothetical protein
MSEKRIEFGLWEREPDVAPIARLSRATGEPLLTYTLRRKRFELWRDSEGRRMGRWDWEYTI